MSGGTPPEPDSNLQPMRGVVVSELKASRAVSAPHEVVSSLIVVRVDVRVLEPQRRRPLVERRRKSGNQNRPTVAFEVVRQREHTLHVGSRGGAHRIRLLAEIAETVEWQSVRVVERVSRRARRPRVQIQVQISRASSARRIPGLARRDLDAPRGRRYTHHLSWLTSASRGSSRPVRRREARQRAWVLSVTDQRRENDRRGLGAIAVVV